jgi:hypothetical protein
VVCPRKSLLNLGVPGIEKLADRCFIICHEEGPSKQIGFE